MLGDLARRAAEFRADAHSILGRHETSRSRVMDASNSLARVTALSVLQEDMLKQAVRCVEVEVFRGAHVLAFAALVDHLQRLAERDHFTALNNARPNWKITSVEDLRENQTDHGFIEALHAAGTISKNEKKAFHGLLSKRNECAHPSDYFPDMNQSLGFISEVLSRIEELKKRYP